MPFRDAEEDSEWSMGREGADLREVLEPLGGTALSAAATTPPPNSGESVPASPAGDRRRGRLKA